MIRKQSGQKFPAKCVLSDANGLAIDTSAHVHVTDSHDIEVLVLRRSDGGILYDAVTSTYSTAEDVQFSPTEHEIYTFRWHFPDIGEVVLPERVYVMAPPIVD